MAYVQLTSWSVRTDSRILKTIAPTTASARTFSTMRTKPKYVTKRKRITQLQKQVEELEQRNQALMEALERVCELLYEAKPGLARSMARDFAKNY